MTIDDLHFRMANDIDRGHLRIEALSSDDQLLFCLIFDAKTRLIEIAFTKTGAYRTFELDDLKRLLDEQSRRLLAWAATVNA